MGSAPIGTKFMYLVPPDAYEVSQLSILEFRNFGVTAQVASLAWPGAEAAGRGFAGGEAKAGIDFN